MALVCRLSLKQKKQYISKVNLELLFCFLIDLKQIIQE